MDNKQELLIALTEAKKAQAFYREKKAKRNFLIYGQSGTGKTVLARTAQRPVWIDQFDPGGTRSVFLAPLIESGDIIVDSLYEGGDFKTWEDNFEKRRKSGFFNCIGTYMLDSTTTWATAMLAKIAQYPLRKETRWQDTPCLADYGVLARSIQKYMTLITALPCDVICTGHIGREKDETTGAITTALLIPGKMSQETFILFDEVYISVVKPAQEKVSFKLQTHNDGMFQARTRMGGGIFAALEEPSIEHLYKKAGLPFQHKPPLKEA